MTRTLGGRGDHYVKLLGPLQADILKVIWSAPEHGWTVAEVHKAVNAVRERSKSPALAYTTILTVMRNLKNGGMLTATVGSAPRRTAHRFHPTTTQQAYRAEIVQMILFDVFYGDVSAMMILLNDVAQRAKRGTA